MTKHVMIDFETYGTDPDAVVLSLGAVLFDRNHIYEQKLWHFHIPSQMKTRSVKAETLQWWLSQSKDAKAVFQRCTLEGMLLETFIPEFYIFFRSATRIWGNGAVFDVSIL